MPTALISYIAALAILVVAWILRNRAHGNAAETTGTKVLAVLLHIIDYVYLNIIWFWLYILVGAAIPTGMSATNGGGDVAVFFFLPLLSAVAIPLGACGFALAVWWHKKNSAGWVDWAFFVYYWLPIIFYVFGLAIIQGVQDVVSFL